jgi:hypothetical protein
MQFPQEGRHRSGNLCHGYRRHCAGLEWSTDAHQHSSLARELLVQVLNDTDDAASANPAIAR